MTCEEARESLSAFLDEALTNEEQASLARHLQGCAECRRERDRLAATISLLHRVAPERAPAGFVDRVLEAARPKPWYARPPAWPARVAPLGLPLGAVAMLLVAGLGVYIFQRSPELQQAARQEAPLARPPETRRQEPPPAAAPPPAAPPSRVMPRAPAPAVTGAKPAAPAVRSRGDEEARLAKKPESAEGAMPGEQRPGASGRAVGSEGMLEERSDAQSRKTTAPSVASPRDKPTTEAPRQALDARAAATAGPAEIAGQLAVTERAAALAALADLAARIGASEIPKAAEADESLVELSLPREAYGALVEGLGRIGRWTPERESTPLPARVRVRIRLSP